MTPERAAAKAFRNCRANNDKSRNVASYLARQYMLSDGATQTKAAGAMQRIDALLDEWFEARKNNGDFTPDVSKYDTEESTEPDINVEF